MRYDCVVTGSGVAGMTAALLLAMSGRKTAVVEKKLSPAALLKGYTRGDVRCQTGFHHTGGWHEGGPLRALFQHLGVAQHLEEIPPDESGSDIFVVDGREYSMPRGLPNIAEGLPAQFHSRERAVTSYLDRVAEINDRTCLLNFKLDYGDFPRELFVQRRSLADELAGLGAHPDFIGMIGMFGLSLTGAREDEAPFYLHAMAAGGFHKKTVSFKGGGKAIADAFLRRLGEEGVEIFCDAGVKALHVGDHRAFRGLSLKGGEFLEAETCVSTIHPKILAGLLPEGAEKPVFHRKLAESPETFQPFVVFVRPPEGAGGVSDSNIYIRDGGDFLHAAAPVPASDGEDGGVMTLTKTVSASDAETFLRGGDSERRELSEAHTQKALSMLAEHMPSARGSWEVVSALDPLDFQNWTDSPGGSIYGMKKTTEAGLLKSSSAVGGLFLAGQSVKNPGLTGSALSALAAVLEMPGREKIWADLKKHV